VPQGAALTSFKQMSVCYNFWQASTPLSLSETTRNDNWNEVKKDTTAITRKSHKKNGTEHSTARRESTEQIAKL